MTETFKSSVLTDRYGKRGREGRKEMSNDVREDYVQAHTWRGEQSCFTGAGKECCKVGDVAGSVDEVVEGAFRSVLVLKIRTSIG